MHIQKYYRAKSQSALSILVKENEAMYRDFTTVINDEIGSDDENWLNTLSSFPISAMTQNTPSMKSVDPRLLNTTAK